MIGDGRRTYSALAESYLEALEVVREHEGNDWKEVNGILEKGESNGKN